MNKPFEEWPKSDRIWFVIDIVGVCLNAGLMTITGFNIIGTLAIIFLTMGGTGIFLKNNPGSITG